MGGPRLTHALEDVGWAKIVTQWTPERIVTSSKVVVPFVEFIQSREIEKDKGEAFLQTSSLSAHWQDTCHEYTWRYGQKFSLGT